MGEQIIEAISVLVIELEAVRRQLEVWVCVVAAACWFWSCSSRVLHLFRFSTFSIRKSEIELCDPGNGVERHKFVLVDTIRMEEMGLPERLFESRFEPTVCYSIDEFAIVTGLNCEEPDVAICAEDVSKQELVLTTAVEKSVKPDKRRRSRSKPTPSIDSPPVYVTNDRQVHSLIELSRTHVVRICVSSQGNADVEDNVHGRKSENHDDEFSDDCDEDWAADPDEVSEGGEDAACDEGDDKKDPHQIDDDTHADYSQYGKVEDEDERETKIPFDDPPLRGCGQRKRMDNWEDNLYEHQSFDSKEELMSELRLTAVMTRFTFKVATSTTKLFVAKCKVAGCAWMVRAAVKKPPRFGIKEANPGSVTDLVRDPDDRFKYCFLSFGASIAGFQYLRRVIVVDGTHLTGTYGGVLLVAAGQDGNFQIFPLAFAIVDAEDSESWEWFFNKLRDCFMQHPPMVIVSDRAKAIARACEIVFPWALRGICYYHLLGNIIKDFHAKEIMYMVKGAAYAHTVPEYNRYMDLIRAAKPELATYLEEADPKLWSRVHFPGDRYNIKTSNIAESINSAVKKAKGYPIPKLLEFIREKLGIWFTKRGEDAMSLTTTHSRRVEYILAVRSHYAASMTAERIDTWCYHVKGGKRDCNVDLFRRTCSCGVYDVEKIPCTHVIAAAAAANVLMSHYVCDCHSKLCLYSTYAHPIYPKAGSDSHVKKQPCLIPVEKVPPGRKKKSRWLTWLEMSRKKNNKPRKMHKKYSCSKCGEAGHTRPKCVFWSILEHMGHKEHGGTWHMEAAQLDTQRKKGEAILKTSSTVHSTNRSSSSTRPAKLQLDRAGESKSNPKNVASPLTSL
ncbi:unnamed protein product [Microthlaspi erraticum]|uniref:SWIM-type domain-containing protein n=1 Tax=Microthlaspi erraticum TaxID=1685480 RepID=A0A6D2I127_9BRAS|nr:unnamed protein product [Microthlaspi erraticum]